MIQIPLATIRRYPAYLRLLEQLEAEGCADVSASSIANRLGLTGVQVRKDLAYTQAEGRPKTGYDLKELSWALREALGWNNATDAYLVGVGSLGEALLRFGGFENHGLNILAAFDTDEKKVNTSMGKKKIFPMDKFKDLVARTGVKIGIITTPKEAAQAVADLMVSAGIKGIWNFAPAEISVPEGIVLQQVDLTTELAVLSARLQMGRENG